MGKKVAPALRSLLKSKKIDFDISNEADFSDLLELNELAWIIKDPSPSPAGLSLLDQPIIVGELTFWKPTIGFLLWQENILSNHLVEGEAIYDATLLYALSKRETFREDVISQPIEKVVKRASKWAYKKLWRLSVTQVEYLLLQLFGVSESNSGGSELHDAQDIYSLMIHHLVANYGGNQDFWLYEASLERLANIVERLGYDNLLEQRANDASLKKAGQHLAPNPKDPSIIALAKFRAKIKEIEARKLSKMESVRYG